MNLSSLMVYAQSIEKYKLERRGKGVKRGRTDQKGQPRFKKRDPNQDVPSASNVNHEKGGGSQIAKPTFSICGKMHFGKYLANTSGCYG